MRLALLASVGLSLAACAQPPGTVAPRNATDVNASQSQTWDAVIDVFAERNIPIRNMERASGFIATDPMSVGSEGTKWADCGKNMSGGAILPTRASYNVLVRGDDAHSTVKVTMRFTSGSFNDQAECSTKGVWEGEMEGQIKSRAETETSHSANTSANPSNNIDQPRQVPGPVDTPQPVIDSTIGRPTKKQAAAAPAVPPGITFVGSLSQKMYYPVGCAAIASVPEDDRVYYTSEETARRAGLRRTIVCP